MAIILASSSPRRKEILNELGIDFKIIISDVDETSNETIPEKLVETLSYRKAYAVSQKASNDDIIIAADTVVAIGDKILGKPANYKEAKNMLKSLSGNAHKVITGICLKRGNNTLTSHDVTYVYFKNLSNEDIDNYLSNDEYIDKAGSYAIQGLGGAFVERIEGSYSNVVGLPKELLLNMLAKIEKDSR